MSEGDVLRVSLLDAKPASGFRPWAAVAPTGTPCAVGESAGEDKFASGFAAGERAAKLHYAAEIGSLRSLLAAVDALQPEPSEEIAAMIATTVERLVTELVGRVPVDREWLMPRIERALACVERADRARTLWLHPDDAVLLCDIDLGVNIMTDVAIERGALRIDCSRGWIEDGRSVHLEALRQTLGVEVSA